MLAGSPQLATADCRLLTIKFYGEKRIESLNAFHNMTLLLKGVVNCYVYFYVPG